MNMAFERGVAQFDKKQKSTSSFQSSLYVNHKEIDSRPKNTINAGNVTQVTEKESLNFVYKE